MKVRSPKLVQDVYRDLRDRRLLVIALALVVAIVAVPFLVRGPEADLVATAEVGDAAPGSEAAIALEPATLVEASELRDYRQRLDGLRSKNPFKQQLTGAGRAATGDEASGGGGAGTPIETQESASAVSAPTDDVTAASAVRPPVVEEGAPADPVEPIDPVGPDPTGDADAGAEAISVLSFTVDVKVGRIGEARVIRDVEEGDLLPGNDGAVVQYLQSELDESSASFVVSRDVTGSSGEGKCSPNRARCDFLRLEVGEEQELEFGDGGEVFKIKLLGVTRQERILAEGPAQGR